MWPSRAWRSGRSIRGSAHRSEDFRLGSQGDKRGTVLVIDDHAELRGVLQRVLERSGYRVDVAENGKEGLDRLRHGRFDLIVLDIDMPVMNGREFLVARARDAKLSAIPVVVYSADPQPAAVPADVTAWIWKGTEVSDLLHALSTAVTSAMRAVIAP
jgi:CheY-like chemotaxis protein